MLDDGPNSSSLVQLHQNQTNTVSCLAVFGHEQGSMVCSHMHILAFISVEVQNLSIDF